VHLFYKPYYKALAAMLNCYIIDDEEHAIKSLVAYIEKTAHLKLMGYSNNPLDALSLFQEKKIYPDITFLDIDMPQMSGIELSALLKDKTAIVFTTAHPNFAIDAFEMDIIDYLLKPISFQRFLKCIDKISARIAEKSNTKGPDNFFYIQSESKGKLIKISFQEILYVESQKNYVSIVTTDKKHLTYLTLIEIEEKLPNSFMRINKSFIINVDKITHIEGNEIFIENIKTGFVVGASYKDQFTAYMKDRLVKTKRFNH
jgi:DNA-binding LytR/AlgR family response regulator